MAKVCEALVLDMGAPVRIDDLARLMVRLMGLEVKSEENPRWGHRYRIQRAQAWREAL